MNRIAFIAVFALSLQSCSQINLGKLQEASDKAESVLFGDTAPALTQAEIIEGLREALVVGAEKSASLASKVDGFYQNSQLRIPFPEDAIKVKEVALDLGFENQVNKFEETLNRAAEEASKEAATIFVGAIKEMTIADGYDILHGADDAATVYLQEKTTDQLRSKFSPVVGDAIEKVELTKYWTPLIEKYNLATMFTGGETIDPDLNAYITQRAIDGLFLLIEKEEKSIREDPAARITDILQKVFGSLDQ